MPAAKVARSRRTILSKPTITPNELHRSKLLRVGLNGIYDACNNGEIECFRRGKKIVIPTAPLRRKLGMEAETPPR